MKNLVDLGIYIVTHTNGKDPVELGIRVGHQLRLRSIEIEDLLTTIVVAKHFGVTERLKEKAEKNISQSPLYENLNKILK